MTFNQKIDLAIEELNRISQERTDSGFITQGRVENHMRIKLSDFRRVLLAMKDPTYPCAKCGKLRTKAEGGTTFTECDACWPIVDPKQPEPEECNHNWGIKSSMASTYPERCYTEYVCFKCQETKTMRPKQPEQEKDEVEEFVELLRRIWPASDAKNLAIQILAAGYHRTKRSES